jgi:hypothetical protein
MSPTVFRDNGYRFFFFSREEEWTHGGSISAIEVTNISAHGLWILARKKELFMLRYLQ